MPSKTLLRPVELHNSTLGVQGAARAEPQIDLAETLKRRESFVHGRKDDSQVKWANDNNIDVVRGHGRLVGERFVEVTDGMGKKQLLEAREAVVIATGSAPTVPPVTGLGEALPWTSRDATNMRDLPRRVAIVGGGVVACESATWLKGLGAEQVTIIERSPTLLAGREPFAGQILGDELKKAGVALLLGAHLESVSRPDAEYTGIGVIHGGVATLSVDGRSFEVDELVVAAGRRPATHDIGLDAVGIKPNDHGAVETDEHLAVVGADSWLYAVGDVNGRALLTHMGKYQARIAGDVISARAEGRPLDGPRYVDLADGDCVPGVIFTDPQIAYVGLTEAAAKERGFNVESLEYDLASVAGSAVLRDDYVGRAKLVVDRETDALLGATFVGAEMAELLHSATIAIIGKVPLETLWHAVPSYPTASEVWLRLLESRRNPS
jgi:dihydrolipoamide dehydrogenase